MKQKPVIPRLHKSKTDDMDSMDARGFAVSDS
jgi:hypothetical protein